MNPKERLMALAHLLAGAGSDTAQITLNYDDAEILEVPQHADEMTVIIVAGTKLVPADPKKPDGPTKLVPDNTEVPVPVGIPQINPATGRVSCYKVCVGYARKALNAKLNGQPVEGLRQPDVQVPTQG